MREREIRVAPIGESHPLILAGSYPIAGIKGLVARNRLHLQPMRRPGGATREPLVGRVEMGAASTRGIFANRRGGAADRLGWVERGRLINWN